MRFSAIREQEDRYPIALMCGVLGVGTSSYWAWRRRPESPRAVSDRTLLTRITLARAGRKKCYGSPRVTKALRAAGTICGRHQVARIMRQAGIKAVARRKFRVTTDSQHDRPVAQNVLGRNFDPPAPDRVWAADITYVWTEEGWLYLAAVMDLYSRRVIGWSMKERLSEDLVLDALAMATETRKPPTGLIHHSDRGSQYSAWTYRRFLERQGATCSMSRRGNCWDNAVMESFFHSLKVECVHLARYATRDEARLDIFDYIEVFYNRERLHSSLGYLSPAQFELTGKVA